VEVEGHTESPDKDGLSRRRAEAVRDALVRRGLPATIVTARGLGNSRPLYANTTAGGREENQRVEIVISGDPIGSLPFWDRTYSRGKPARGDRDLGRPDRQFAFLGSHLFPGGPRQPLRGGSTASAPRSGSPDHSRSCYAAPRERDRSRPSCKRVARHATCSASTT